MEQKLREDLEFMRSHILQAHDDLSDIWAKEGSDEFHESIVTLVMLSRSKSLVRGFYDLMLSCNLTTAGALLRLQLDNLLRLVAMFIASDRHEFFHAMMNGENISRLRDASGNRMTDKYLCDRVAVHAPWVSNIYKQASGFIHFSYKHVRATVQGDPAEQRISVWMAEDESHLPDDSYESIGGIFGLVTRMLLDFIYEASDPNDLDANLSYPDRMDRALKRMAKGIGDAIEEYGIPATQTEIDYIPESEL
jgi:hypothetical protein